jgi:hypothetical protein
VGLTFGRWTKAAWLFTALPAYPKLGTFALSTFEQAFAEDEKLARSERPTAKEAQPS